MWVDHGSRIVEKERPRSIAARHDGPVKNSIASDRRRQEHHSNRADSQDLHSPRDDPNKFGLFRGVRVVVIVGIVLMLVAVVILETALLQSSGGVIHQRPRGCSSDSTPHDPSCRIALTLTLRVVHDYLNSMRDKLGESHNNPRGTSEIDGNRAQYCTATASGSYSIAKSKGYWCILCCPFG